MCFDASWSSITGKDTISGDTSTAVTNDVGTVEAADTDPPPWPRDGHSFFQCPFLRHSLQYELAIRLARDDFPFPFTFPFFPKPFSPFFTLQKPRNLTFSDKRFLASWYDE